MVKNFRELKKLLQKNPNIFKEEGVDHIRLSPYSNTNIGKWLSPEYNKKITLPVLGEFSSVRNFWVWLTTEGHPDQIRSINPKNLEKWLRENTLKKGKSLKYFTILIGYAKYQQLLKYKPELEDLDLPLLVYTETKERFRATVSYETWYVALMSNILDAYRNGRKPIFFSDDQEEVDIEEYIKTKIFSDLFGQEAPSMLKDKIDNDAELPDISDSNEPDHDSEETVPEGNETVEEDEVKV